LEELPNSIEGGDAVRLTVGAGVEVLSVIFRLTQLDTAPTSSVTINETLLSVVNEGDGIISVERLEVELKPEVMIVPVEQLEERRH
jgi:hypothetical protein